MVSTTTTVELGIKPVTVTVPSAPVVYRPIRFPSPSRKVNSVLGTGFPETASFFVRVKEQRGSLYTVIVWVSAGFTVTVWVWVLWSMT